MEIILISIFLIVAATIGLIIRSRSIIESFSIIASLAVLIESSVIILRVSSDGIYSPLSYVSVDSLGSIVIFLIALIGFTTSIYSVAYLRKETEKGVIGFTRVREYFILLNIFLLVMILAVSINSPILAWIFVEATTLSTAFLVSFYNKPSAIEGAWKYLVINSVGLLLGFFGTLLYFTSINESGGFGFLTWNNLLSNVQNLDPMIAKIAFVFVLIGYGTKAGLAPMHTWLPDAHSKAPVPISALLSGVLLNVAFFMILKFKVFTDLVAGPAFSQKLLIIFGLLSIFIAAFTIIRLTNYKRLLAYSSIENMGILALGFGLGGLGVFAATMHMIYHSLIKSTLFLSAGNIFLKFGSTKIKNIKGALQVLPITSILFISGFLAITGVPPFGLFITKLEIIMAGIETYPIISAIALLLMALVFVGFLKHVTAMFFSKKTDDIEVGEGSVWLVLPQVILLIVIITLSFYIPPFLLNIINNIVLYN